MSDAKIEENAPGFKKVISVIFSVIFCVLVGIFFIFAAFVFIASCKTPSENTFEILGYKIYCAQDNIEQTDIKQGSLVIIKDTNDDEFYTVEAIEKNAVIIPKLGKIIKNDAGMITFCVAVGFALVFVMIFFAELYKKITRQKNEELTFEFSPQAPCEIDEN